MPPRRLLSLAAALLAAAAPAAGERRALPGAGGGGAGAPWVPSSAAAAVPVAAHAPGVVRARPAAWEGHVGADEARYRTSRRLADALGLDDDDDDALGGRGGDDALRVAARGPRGGGGGGGMGGDDDDSDDGEDVEVSDLPPSVLKVRAGSLAEALDIAKLWPLMQVVDFPVRVALMTWTVYDKLRRTLKLLAPKPFLQECEEFFLMVHGVELHAMEGMKHMLENVKHIAHDQVEAHRVHAEAIKHLADNLMHGVHDGAEFALNVGKNTFKRLLARGKHDTEALRHAVLRIADSVQHKNGKWEAQGDSIDLSGEVLEEAAELDVTAEFVPDHVHAKTRLKLLGLVASLGHEDVFKKVQAALHHNDTEVELMSIDDFKAKQGVHGVAELVKKMVHKYTTPSSVLHGYIALYTVSHLRQDPKYFQAAWGMRLGALVSAAKFPSPIVHKVANWALGGFHLMEARHRGHELLHLVKHALAGHALSAWDWLQGANAFLTLTLFATGKTEHEHLTMETMYDWLAERMLE